MIYYTSDIHFNHKKIIESCNRPFKDIDEMNESLIGNWNVRVKKEDTVYYLGDFAIVKNNKDVQNIIDLVRRLNGRKILIQGNHDSRLVKNIEFSEMFEEISIYKKINDNGRYVILMHYPIESWERSYYGSYHIHGHTHNNCINNIKNRFNAGVDVNDYKPVTLDELIKFNLN